MRIVATITAVYLLLALAAPAQTFTVLHTFHRGDGAQPVSALVQGLDGSFYGTTSGAGGTDGHGTIFKITPAGVFTSLHVFSEPPDGATPYGGLTLVPDGTFYGVTSGTSISGLAGTVFKYSSDTLTTLHTFSTEDGAHPYATLLLAADGNLYGTTTQGGTPEQSSIGTVFRITESGDFAGLYNFASGGDDGEYPYGALAQNDAGAIYGTTRFGGAHNQGTLFRINKAGSFTTLYSFCAIGDTCTDGATTFAGLIQGADGAFYGVTYSGGNATCAPSNVCGTAFKYDKNGLITLHSFQGNDGGAPEAPLYQGTDGNLYGTASNGGHADSVCGLVGCGTIFSVTPSGVFNLLYQFCAAAGCADGARPLAGLVQGTDGNFYGATNIGGSSNVGVIYKLSVGLPPFIKLLPGLGVTGQSIRILGNNLLGTTGVTFNGAPAEFTVNTNSFITAKVPAGVTSGTVQVMTPNGVLSSNVAFQVSR
ncbi:MAG: hypothetical protein H0X25_09485 [Acidobacteriales bacterium]|nr:hypothetical protein [Terriglobales bacterium]